MIGELQNASKLLEAALDRYIAACSAIANCIAHSHTLETISHEISDNVVREMERMTLYETKIRTANMAIKQTRNAIPAITPINMLPPDLLSHIFQLVHDAQGASEDIYLHRFSTNYSEILSRVCSRWRQISLGSRILWSRIDIPMGSILTRAKLFAARADPLPVDIRVIGRSHIECPWHNLDAFCTSIATRTRSFYYLHHSRPVAQRHIGIFQNYLANCKPGLLNKLVLISRGRQGLSNTIVSAEAPISPQNLSLEMPHDYLEDRLRPIKVLQLTGLYFHWESQAYHGLVELRLLSAVGPEVRTITQSQLKTILTASPQLRELYFGLEITEVLPHNTSRTAVRLNDLEVVNLCSMSKYERFEAVLELLAPGSKPLQLLVRCPFTDSSPFLSSGAIEFTARSNVTKLHIQSVDQSNFGTARRKQRLMLLDLFRLLHVPNLRALSLHDFVFDPNLRGDPPDQSQFGETSSDTEGVKLRSRTACSQLAVMYLRDCHFDLNYLSKVVEMVPVQKLNHSGCHIQVPDLHRTYYNENPPGAPHILCHARSAWSSGGSDPWA